MFWIIIIELCISEVTGKKDNQQAEGKNKAKDNRKDSNKISNVVEYAQNFESDIMIEEVFIESGKN